MKGALEGVRIADFTWAWAGPYATFLLGFMGAEIIKIETAKRPDFTRLQSITTRQRFEGMNQSPVFNDINLNKLSATIDLTQPKGVELAKRIVEISDVVTQNMRPGAMDRLGLGYEALKEVKPDIIYLSSSALGAIGPDREYIGFAPIFHAIGGAAHLTGYPDGDPSPQAGSIDMRSGTAAAFAVLAALNCRQRTGIGQHIDLSSSETVSVLSGDAIMDYTMNNRVQSRRGNLDDIMAPHNCYPTQGEDKWVSIAISTDEEWRAFCDAIGNPEWTRDTRFADQYSRWKNQEELDKLVGEWTRGHTHYEVMEALQAVGVAATPSFSNQEIFEDRHLKERGLATEVTHQVIGKQVVIGAPWKLSQTPAEVRQASPLLGEHNQYVFEGLLGMSKQEVQSLVDEKVIC